MTIQQAVSIWEEVVMGTASRMDPRFIESIRAFGRTVTCQPGDMISELFVRAGMCSSKSDFKRSMGGLSLDEQPITKDEPIGERMLLRRGKSLVVLAVRVPVV